MHKREFPKCSESAVYLSKIYHHLLKKIVLIVLGMPDSEAFGDVGVDTFGHIADTVKTMEIPNLKKLGILNLHPQKICSSRSAPSAARGFRSCYKRCFFRSIRQAKERVLLEVFYFFLYTGGKGGDAFGTTGIQLFFKTYYAVVLR